MMRRFMQGVFGCALFLAFAVAPAAATPTVPAAATAQCVLQPGVYGIIDSSGKLIAILIVYPDCRLEVFKAAEPD